MKVEADVVLRIQIIVDDPRNGAKVTAGRIGIGRVTLWRLLTFGVASPMTMRRVSRFIETTETPKSINRKDSLCIITI